MPRISASTSIAFAVAFFLAPMSTVAIAQQELKPATQNDETRIEERVTRLLQKLSLDQKLELIGGYEEFYVHPEPSIGLPALRMADGSVGIRNAGPSSTAYPASIALAATFDADLAREEGEAVGRDARARGVHFVLGPGVNLYRAPMNGRNFEYLGEDPYLASRMAVPYIQGLQTQGVSATVKHFALNNEDYDRHNLDAHADQRTMRELYLPAFEAAVREGQVGAIMDSYNLVNGLHSTENPDLNLRLAKDEWKFPGIIMSDWYSTYNGLAAAKAGLDLEMPSAKAMNARILKAALNDGSLDQATLDDKVRRILRLSVRMGWLDRDQTIARPQDDPASRAVSRKVALASMTLLKNEGDVLPLSPSRTCRLAVLGPNADRVIVGGGGSSQVVPVHAQTIVTAMRAVFPATGKCPGVVYAAGIPTPDEVFRTTHFIDGIAEELFAQPDFTQRTATSVKEHLIPLETPTESRTANRSARWTATYLPVTSGPLLVFLGAGNANIEELNIDGSTALKIPKPDDHLYATVRVNGLAGVPIHLELKARLEHNFEAVGLGILPLDRVVSQEAKDIASKADAVIVIAGFDRNTEGEGFDRTFSLPAGQDELIEEVSRLNPRTIVALEAGGGVDMAPWLGQVRAILHLWYPGEEGGEAFASLVSGESNPEGHLPISIERSFADNPVHDTYYPERDSAPGHPTIRLDEGVFVGYRFYAGSVVKPLFPFGFGLSYTKFKLSDLKVDSGSGRVRVRVTVQNVGARAGGDAIQVYVGEPGAVPRRPVEELKAFRKVHLAAGEKTHLEFFLDRRAFSYWATGGGAWKMDAGEFTIMAGDSSSSPALTARVSLSPALIQ